MQTFLVPDQETYVVSSVDVLLSGDDATACNVQGSLRRNNATTFFTAGDWQATSTNSVAVLDNPNAFGVYNLTFDNTVLSPGTYAFILSLSGTCGGGGHVVFGLATSTNTYASGTWFVSTAENATSSSQGSYADRSVWFRVNGAGYTPNTGISIVSPASGSYLTPFSTTIYVSLSQPTPGNLKVMSNFPVNGSTTIGSANGVTAGTYAFPVTFNEKVNYQVRAQFFVDSNLYAQSDPKQYQLGGVFFSTSTSPEGICPEEGLFASWSSFWCQTTQAVIIPSEGSKTFMKSQFLRIETIAPFSYFFRAVDTVKSVALATQASSSPAQATISYKGNAFAIFSNTGLQDMVGTTVKNRIFEFQKYVFWLAAFIIMIVTIVKFA